MKPAFGRTLACVLIAAAGAAPPLPAFAQGAAPRIGLALSGGGARGLAHIGVLKVLEELRVPVSCVTGTSMGAVVGGAFASGRTPSQMEETVLKTNWDEVFNDRPPRQEVSIRRKADDYKTLFAPELGVKDGLSLPKGIIAGLSIESYFRALVGPGGEVADFSKLPVPFRAMASDIVTGESVVLSSGSVAQAMRASMSVPGAVAPVEIQGRLLVDGGISNNLPIDEARKLCSADAVIAVNISTPPLKREEITSALSVSLQLVNLLGKNTVDQQLKNLSERDVLVEPALGDISAGSFDRAKDAIRLGEEAARALADKLKRYSVPQEQYAAIRNNQTTIKQGLGKVDEIRFEGLRRSNPAVLSALVESKPGEELDEEKVGEDLRRIYGRGDFEGVDYRIVNEAGKRVMLIEPKEKSWGPDYFRIGLGLATDFTSDSQFNVLAQYRKTLLNRLGGEWLSELQVGKDNRLYTEFYQPIEERGRWFVAPSALAQLSTRPIYQNGDRVAIYDVTRIKGAVDGGAVLGTWGEVRLGPVYQHIKASIDTGSPLLPNLNEISAGMAARLVGDHLDHAWFPREGHRMVLTYYAANRDFGSDRNYQRIEGRADVAKSFGAHTLNASLYAGSNLGSNMPAYETFTLGGPLNLSGYRINEFSGQRAWLAKVLYYNRAIKLPDILGSGVYLGGSLETGKVSDRFDGTPSRQLGSMSAFLAADSFLGPAYFGFGWGGSSRFSLYLVLGVP